MRKHSVEKFIDEDTIKSYVGKIAGHIIADYKGLEDRVEDISHEGLTFITVLDGAKTFASDLMIEIWKIDPTLKIRNYFIKLSSYGQSIVSSGKVIVKKEIEGDIKNKDVIIIEDLVETGNTLNFLKDYLIETKSVSSVKICALLDKQASKGKINVSIDYKGVEIPDEFIVGYGVDYAEKYRELPYIGIVKFKE
ncbi:MAG: hypoxanthine phosphoribosyltransferase [Nanoarchaeota archaeon]|nr:hypoxanthine phosphoribosyltransferase [Nanoarchaeota archaeon]